MGRKPPAAFAPAASAFANEPEIPGTDGRDNESAWDRSFILGRPLINRRRSITGSIPSVQIVTCRRFVESESRDFRPPPSRLLSSPQRNEESMIARLAVVLLGGILISTTTLAADTGGLRTADL